MSQVKEKTNIRLMSNRIYMMEDELQEMKISLARPVSAERGIVQKTRGVLGRKFPTGLAYQKKVRAEWKKREKKFSV